MRERSPLTIFGIRAKEGSFPGVGAVVTFELGFIAKSPFLQNILATDFGEAV